MNRHNVWIPNELWNRAEKAARLASVDEDEKITVSELIRRGLRRELAEIEERHSDEDE